MKLNIFFSKEPNQFASLELLEDFWGFLEHRFDQSFGHDDLARLLGVRMHGFQKHIVDVRANTQGGVARQSPWGGRPRNRVCRAVTLWQPLIIFQIKQRHASQILHIARAPRHVQFV